MIKTDVLLGLQWGDEGKGKIVDVLTPQYDIVARFQGGPNAGHSLEFNEIKHVLHSIPSGIFHQHKINVIGNGVVLDPAVFKKEIDELVQLGVDPTKNLVVSKKAHLILPTHALLDAASESSKGKTKIGSTLRGIGPTYMDKTGRNGIRVGDILDPNFHVRYEFLKNKHIAMLSHFDFEFNKVKEAEWWEGIEMLRKFKLIDSEHYMHQLMQQNQKVLAEGAQGTLLDIDFGTYPYVTSSNTISAGACTGLGIAPNQIGEVYGIFKAYCTRVGSGPFPTELHDEVGQKLREAGHEFGATTGRERRCGWLDLPALKYAVNLNGVTQLIMTKADVLDSFDQFKVAVAYQLPSGETIDYLPYQVDLNLTPVYKTFKGWKNSSAANKMEDIPTELKNYIQFIEKQTGVNITIVSLGPNRDQTLFLNNH